MSNDPAIIKLSNVRLSYPELFTAKAFQGGKPAFSAVFLLNKTKDAAQIAAIKTAINAVAKEAFKGKLPPKTCLRDGSEKPDTDGYGADIVFVSARNEKRPGVVNRDLTPLTAEDGKPYAGCYVNAVIRLWAQDNEFGKRINASLRNVQFVRDGEPFGEKPVAPEQDFDALPEDDSAVV